MTIIGLSGSIGSGKTTLADYLAEEAQPAGHWESWQLIAEIAEALRNQDIKHPTPDDSQAIIAWLQLLPKIISDVCHKQIAFSQLQLTEAELQKSPKRYAKLQDYLGLMQADPHLTRMPITEENKESFRPLLQWLGGYLAATCGGDIWYGEIIRRIRQTSGLHLAIIGGVRFLADAECIKAAGGINLGVVRPDLPAKDERDPTERERKRITVDVTIYNDGNLRDLRSCAKRLSKDLVHGSLRTVYRAATESKA